MRIKSIKTSIYMLALMATAAVMTSCDKKTTSTNTSGLAKIVCDESFENIIAEEINVYEFDYPDSNIMPYYEDEKAAFDSLIDRSVKCIVVARPLSDKEKSYFKSNDVQFRESQIAVDAVALIVNPENPIDVLSQKDVADILSGRYTKWSDIEPGAKGDISVVFDNQNSSIVRYMREKALKGAEFGSNVYAQGSSPAVFEAVSKNRGAIGIIGVSWISSDLKTREMSTEEKVKAMKETTNVNLGEDMEFDTNVKVLKIDGETNQAVKPSQTNIYTGDYPYTRPIYMIITGPNGTLVHGFYSFVTSNEGRLVILSTGVMPALFEKQKHMEII